MAVEDQVVTGEAVALDLRTAGAGSRGIAAAIDLVLALLVLVIVLVVVGVTVSGSDSATASALVLSGFVGVVLGYPVALETLWHGRTVGKACLGLRVVRDDGGPVRFRHALVRGLVGVFLDRPGLSVAVLALVPMVATQRSKRLGDLLAGTIVLQDRVPAPADLVVPMPPPLAGWAAGLDLSAVDDPLALRARQLLGRARSLAPAVVADLERQLVGELAARVGPPPPDAPGWAVIAAVLAERRDRALRQAAPSTLPAPGPSSVPPSPSGPPLVAAPPTAQLPPDEPEAEVSRTGFAPPG